MTKVNLISIDPLRVKLKCEKCGWPVPPPLTNVVSCCAQCGQWFPHVWNMVEGFLKNMVNLQPELESALRQLEKDELTSAVRESLITLEETVRKLSGLRDLSGADLMAKAFTYALDDHQKLIIKRPYIAINDLSMETKRNEQDGIKYMTMGLMRGFRNIYTHTRGLHETYTCISILITVNLVIKQLPKQGYRSVTEQMSARDELY